MFPDAIVLERAFCAAQIAACTLNSPDFALKGGTALNLYGLNMPRLSLDVDLVFLPEVKAEEASWLQGEALFQFQKLIEQRLPDAEVMSRLDSAQNINALVVRLRRIETAVELVPTTRGHLYPLEKKNLCALGRIYWHHPLPAQLVSWAEVCAGKFMARLERQKARDLMDCDNILKLGPIDDQIRLAFLVEILGRGMPTVRMNSQNLVETIWFPLSPADLWTGEPRPVDRVDWSSLTRLVAKPMLRSELDSVQDVLRQELLVKMPAYHKDFLLMWVRGTPHWSLLDYPRLEDRPILQYHASLVAEQSVADRIVLADQLAEAMASGPRFLSASGSDTLSTNYGLD